MSLGAEAVACRPDSLAHEREGSFFFPAASTVPSTGLMTDACSHLAHCSAPSPPPPMP